MKKINMELSALQRSLVGVGRTTCPVCGTRFKDYCQKCQLPLTETPPPIKLPLVVDLYKHPQELASKTTSTHMSILTSTNVYGSEMKIYPVESRVLLLFPSPSALPLSALDLREYDTLVVIDGTWSQAKQMIRGTQFQMVTLDGYQTEYWRFQKWGLGGLATVEACFWFFVDFECEIERQQAAKLASEVNNELDTRIRQNAIQKYDGMLFYFKMQHHMIQQRYQESGKQFTSRHLLADSYIKPRPEV